MILAGAGGPSGSGRSAEGVGDGVAAVAAEGAAGDLHAGAGLAALVLGQLQHAPHAVHQLAVVAALDDGVDALLALDEPLRSEEHTSELQSLMRISYAVFCLKKNNTQNKT